jgi:hypothetical protein
VHHNEDEISRVLKGRFRLCIGEETVEPGPGGTLVMPHCYGSGVVHAAERCQERSRRLTASPAERPDPEALSARRTALTPPAASRPAAISSTLRPVRRGEPMVEALSSPGKHRPLPVMFVIAALAQPVYCRRVINHKSN